VTQNIHPPKALDVGFVGTFGLISIGAGTVVALDPSNFVAIDLAHGFVNTAFAYAFGKESNSYLNPALTLGVLIAGEGGFAATVPVFLAHCVGSIIGGLALAGVYSVRAAHNLGMTTINLNITSLAGGFWLEAIGAFVFMTIVLNTALRGVAGKFAPLAIGMTVAFCIMSFGSVTGAAVNPARTLRPAIDAGKMTDVIPYTIAQFAGAIVAALLYRFLFAMVMGDEKESDKSEIPAFQTTLISF
jgi:glycerol uptake facilitator-like aquaporin